MNNDLAQFSEERLKQMVKFCETSIHGLPKHFEASEVAALARIALAAKQAKPVAWITWHQGFRAPDDCEDYLNAYTYKTEEKSVDGSDAFPVYTTPQPAHAEQLIKVTQTMLDAAVADYCTTGKYTVENIPYELRRQVEFEAESTFKAMLAAAPKPESE